MVPTLIVYFASIPAFLYLINGNDFSYLNLIGLIIMVIATFIELLADLDMKKFKEVRTSKNQIINIGLVWSCISIYFI